MFCDSSLDLRHAAACLLARILAVTTRAPALQGEMPLAQQQQKVGSELAALVCFQ